MEVESALLRFDQAAMSPAPLNQSDEVHQAGNEYSYNKKKVKAIISVLERDLAGEEMKWCLFVAACQSYRHHTCLHPFPPMYKNNNGKDIEGLLYTLDHTPQFPHLFQFLQRPELYQLRPEVIQLLYWLLVQLKDPKLRSVPKDVYGQVLNLVPRDELIEPPTAILQLVYGRNSLVEAKWKANKADYSSLYAYHPNRLENFHYILNHGLQPHLNDGVFLSSDSQDGLSISPKGHGWGKSQLGGELSVIALCELVNHPSLSSDNFAGSCGEKSFVCTGSGAPENYYLISNSDLVRLRFLLVYGSEPSPMPNTQCVNTVIERNSFFGWMGDHKFLMAIVCYWILFTSIRISKK